MFATLPPAQLYQFAREERARRKAAWKAAGQGLSDRARMDDIIWSNIEHRTGRAAGDADCTKRRPYYYTLPECIVMARNAWATASKAEASLDGAIAANADKILGLWRLYQWLRPTGWSPYADEAQPVRRTA